jgi:large subunit ribosomal protein L31
MKSAIHPTYFKNAVILCACGTKLETGSTLEKIDIELCSKCHPFYSGKQKILDTARRVEKFEARAGKKGVALDHKAKIAKKAVRATKRAEKKAKAEK